VIVALLAASAFSVGEFKLIYDPAVDATEPWCLNDHTFVKGSDKRWHMFGITHVKPFNFAKDPGRNLAHATANRLTLSPWKKEPFALTADLQYGEHFFWAPHVVRVDKTYHMFVCAGASEGHEYRLHHLTSKDLRKWERDSKNPILIDGFDARDPMLLRDGERWILYYTANSKPDGGNHIVAAVTSTDLVNWSERKVVFTHPRAGTFAGPTESPFVVRRGPRYYLFVTDNDVVHAYASEDPLKWDFSREVGSFEGHACEVVRDEKGNWFISHVGWMNGGLSLAPLNWHDGLDGHDASL
jgi:predicted GH43/DUF377 family glycosyl hydrolase